MAQGNEKAEFQVNLAGNAADVAKVTASAMDGMRKAIANGRNSLEGMNAQLKSLKDAKASKASIDALSKGIADQKKAVSGLSGELKRQGIAHRETTKAAKAEKAEMAVLKSALDKTKTQYAETLKQRKKIGEDNLKERLKHDREAFDSLAGTIGGTVVGAMLGLVTAMAVAGVGLAKFIFRAADAARSVGLLREAAMNGNAQWGKNFGEQVDALARKVPTSKAEIDKLGISLAKSRIGGQVWVDTLNAVTQASAALGDDAGNALKGFVERGRQFNRFQLNPLEMVGTGIDFKDVAEALSKSMHVGVKDATQALFEGRVKLADGAAALRAAVEKKVGGVNLRQMLSFENLTKKIGESLEELTKGIDLEPMLKGFKEIANIFSITTTSGQALKQMVEVFGKELTGAFTTGTPLAKKFVYGLIIGAQEIMIAYLQVRNRLKETFGNTEVLKNVNTLELALKAGKVAAYGLGAAVLMTAGFIAAASAPFLLLGAAIYGLGKAVQFTVGAIRSIGSSFVEIGTSMVDGLINGLQLGSTRLKDAVKGMAESAKSTFKDVLGIHSPSREFFKFGENIDEGAARGVESNGRAQGAVESMVSVPSAAPKGGAGGGSPVSVKIEINVNGGGDAKQIAAALTTESILEQITKAVLDAVQGGGVPVPA